YSVPARTFVAPLTGKSFPLRWRTATGAGVSPRRPSRAPTTMPPPRPPAAAGAAPGAAPRPTATAAGAAPGAPPRPPGPPGPPAPRSPPPPAPIFIRPTPPLHTAAFQAGFISQP